MGIEPIGSAMTFQAQQVSQPVIKADTATDGQEVQFEAPQVDNKTLVVEKPQESNTNGGADQEESGGQQLNDEMIRQAMKELNKKATSVEAEFGIHEKTNRITIKMVDKKTKKVIKELPPERMLDMIAKVWELAGLVVDEKR